MPEIEKKIIEKASGGGFQFTQYGEFLTYYHSHLQLFQKFIQEILKLPKNESDAKYKELKDFLVENVKKVDHFYEYAPDFAKILKVGQPKLTEYLTANFMEVLAKVSEKLESTEIEKLKNRDDFDSVSEEIVVKIGEIFPLGSKFTLKDGLLVIMNVGTGKITKPVGLLSELKEEQEKLKEEPIPQKPQVSAKPNPETIQTNIQSKPQIVVEKEIPVIIQEKSILKEILENYAEFFTGEKLVVKNEIESDFKESTPQKSPSKPVPGLLDDIDDMDFGSTVEAPPPKPKEKGLLDDIDDLDFGESTSTQPVGLLDDIEEESTPGLLDDIEEESTPGLLDDIEEESTPGLLDDLEEESKPGLLDDLEDESSPGLLDDLDEKQPTESLDDLEEDSSPGLLDDLDEKPLDDLEEESTPGLLNDLNEESEANDELVEPVQMNEIDGEMDELNQEPINESSLADEIQDDIDLEPTIIDTPITKPNEQKQITPKPNLIQKPVKEPIAKPILSSNQTENFTFKLYTDLNKTISSYKAQKDLNEYNQWLKDASNLEKAYVAIRMNLSKELTGVKIDWEKYFQQISPKSGMSSTDLNKLKIRILHLDKVKSFLDISANQLKTQPMEVLQVLKTGWPHILNVFGFAPNYNDVEIKLEQLLSKIKVDSQRQPIQKILKMAIQKLKQMSY
jgi:hypothetical protein